MKQAKRKKRRTPITLLVLLVLLAVVSVELIRVYGQLDSAKSERETMSQELEQQKRRTAPWSPTWARPTTRSSSRVWPRISWAWPRTASGSSMMSTIKAHFA